MMEGSRLLLWIVFAVLCVIAVVIVAAPLARAPREKADERACAPATSADLEVYKAQLRELDADVERGVIAAEEAGAARIEISRRLLAEQARLQGRETAARGNPKLALVAISTAVPVAAAVLYLVLGAPNLPGQPMAQRMAQQDESQDLQLLVARVEKHLADNAEDGRGWEVLAPVYRRLGRFEDAARAFANTIRLLGGTAERHADYGEMLVAAADGLVNEEAVAAFERAVELDSQAIKPRFFLAMSKEQDGDREGAIAAWKELLATPRDPDGPWRGRVRERLAALGAEPPAGPTREQVAAAQEMSSAERAQMIEAMVAGLAERLQSGDGDVDDWVRLIRAYTVLGRDEDAAAAAARARENFAGNDAALGRIDQAAGQPENGS